LSRGGLAPVSAMAVAVVNYNTRAHLRACLASAVAAGAPQVVVADNGSTDGSIEMVETEFPDAVLLVDESNPGYGGAANAAIAHCDTEYVVLLNSDTVLRTGALRALCEHLDAHPRAAVVGPRLVNPDGTLQRSVHQFPTPLITLLDYSWVGWVVGLVPGLRKLYLASDSHARARVVPWVTGAALAIRKSAFDAVGGFDPSFFMYYEEVDLSYRLHRAGWETHFAPVTDVTHVGGASTSQQYGAMYAQQMAAALQFSGRHHGPAAVRGTAWALRFALRSRLTVDAIRYRVARDNARRRRLADEMTNVRSLLRNPWRPTTRQART
jgi:GT2 family glycosyltransferase